MDDNRIQILFNLPETPVPSLAPQLCMCYDLKHRGAFVLFKLTTHESINKGFYLFFFLLYHNHQPGGTQTLTDFDVKWRHWHGEVNRCLQDNSFASNQHLEVICKVRAPRRPLLQKDIYSASDEFCLRYTNVTLVTLIQHLFPPAFFSM